MTYDKEVLRWKTKRACATKKPSGLVETMETIHSSHYSPYNAYDMSTVTPGCSFSTVHRIQSYKRSTMRTEQLSFLTHASL